MNPESKIRLWLEQQGFDGILLSKRNNFSWLTLGRVNHIVNTTEFGVADLVILRDKKFCITTKMESKRIMEEELAGLDYELVESEWYEGTEGTIQKICQGKRMCADHVRNGMTDVSSSLVSLRSTLSDLAIQQYTELCQQAATAVEQLCHEIFPGLTEFEIASRLTAKIIPQGINPQVILVATDDRILKYKHPLPTSKQLERYAMVVLCAEKWGLVANVTRFVHFGNMPGVIDKNKRKLAKIDTIMNTSTRPGIKVGDIFKIGINAYEEAGHPDDWRFLHQGGLTGYAPREYLATMFSEGIVQENQAFAWNPAIYGIKSEDTILVGVNENQFLTHTDNWVYMEVIYKGQAYQRPDVLIR